MPLKRHSNTGCFGVVSILSHKWCDKMYQRAVFEKTALCTYAPCRVYARARQSEPSRVSYLLHGANKAGFRPPCIHLSYCLCLFSSKVAWCRCAAVYACITFVNRVSAVICSASTAFEVIAFYEHISG